MATHILLAQFYSATCIDRKKTCWNSSMTERLRECHIHICSHYHLSCNSWSVTVQGFSLFWYHFHFLWRSILPNATVTCVAETVYSVWRDSLPFSTANFCIYLSHPETINQVHITCQIPMLQFLYRKSVIGTNFYEYFNHVL